MCLGGTRHAETSLIFLNFMLNAPAFLKPLLASPVAVLGAGVSGRAAARLVEHLQGAAVIYDEVGGDGVCNEFTVGGHKLLIVSPGFSPGHSWVIQARSAGVVCLAELDFASVFWRGAVVAITGTNGKTTLTEFLSYALDQADRDATAVGNIGRAFSDVKVAVRIRLRCVK